jgi:hypothetical protein
MSTNVERFIQLQTTINEQIGAYGEADIQLVGELELLGDQLTPSEIVILVNQIADGMEDGEQYEDVEWMDI